MSDVDFTGSRALSHVLDDCDRRHVTFGVARAGGHAHEMLQRSGLAHRIGECHFYSSVDQAVTGLTAGPASPS
jgi:MFS superfamily sulfate permease-like transporter